MDYVCGAKVLLDFSEIIPALLMVMSIYGQVCCGKTRATKAALSVAGTQNTNFFSIITDARTYRFAGMTTLGMVIDDPRKDRELAK